MPISPEERARELELELQEVRRQARLRKDLQEVEVFVRKVQARVAAEDGGAGFSTYTSACTSACFSSAACLCAQGALQAASLDLEVAGAFATLHRRGVEVLGEEGFMDAIVAKARERAEPPLNPFAGNQ